jgi:hypothetical protein
MVPTTSTNRLRSSPTSALSKDTLITTTGTTISPLSQPYQLTPPATLALNVALLTRTSSHKLYYYLLKTLLQSLTSTMHSSRLGRIGARVRAPRLPSLKLLYNHGYGVRFLTNPKSTLKWPGTLSTSLTKPLTMSLSIALSPSSTSSPFLTQPIFVYISFTSKTSTVTSLRLTGLLLMDNLSPR